MDLHGFSRGVHGISWLRHESSTPTSQELSSSIFQSLWWGVGVTWQNLHFFQYMKANKYDADPVSSLISLYHLILTQYHQVPSTNHCCPILTQYTASPPRNTQLSQLDLVFSWFSWFLEVVLVGCGFSWLWFFKVVFGWFPCFFSR